jgi:hypothetical protein
MQTTTTKHANGVRRSRAEWTSEVSEWRGSGLSAADYAKQRGLNRGTLLWWSRKVGRNHAEHSAAPRSAAAPVTFVPVRVREEILESAAGGQGSIEIILCNGRRVRVAGAVDGGILGCVLDAAEGAR